MVLFSGLCYNHIMHKCYTPPYTLYTLAAVISISLTAQSHFYKFSIPKKSTSTRMIEKLVN
jgi:hypothetical protein